VTFHPERYVGLCLLLLVLTLVAPSAADWWRTASQLPSGYGAEGDLQRASRIPPPARTPVEELSDGPEGSWVRESVAGGARGHEPHVYEDGKPSGIRIPSDGNVIPPNKQEPGAAPGGAGEAGE
jgi:hypothetical protein